jgi:hypothetical protein
LSSQRWRQIEELYHQACEHGVAVLDGAGREIRREVEKLLAHNSPGGGKLLDQRAADLITGLIDMPIAPGFRLALTEWMRCSGREAWAATSVPRIRA